METIPTPEYRFFATDNLLDLTACKHIDRCEITVESSVAFGAEAPGCAS